MMRGRTGGGLGVIVLAGGLSRRMGRAKLLLPWGAHRSILSKSLSILPDFDFSYRLLVSGGYRDAVEAIAGEHDLPSVYNDQFATGEMLSSLKRGVAEIVENGIALEGVVVLLGDMPLLQAETLHAVMGAFETHPNAWLVAPVVEERQGHPVIIRSTLFEELLALPPSGAPRVLFKRYPDRVLRVPVEDRGAIIDIDTPELYETYRP